MYFRESFYPTYSFGWDAGVLKVSHICSRNNYLLTNLPPWRGNFVALCIGSTVALGDAQWKRACVYSNIAYGDAVHIFYLLMVSLYLY